MKKLHIQPNRSARSLIGVCIVLITTLFFAGCSSNALQQREQAIASQQQQLTKDQQQLEEEKSALMALKAELEQEKNRLEVLKKQPIISNNGAVSAQVNRPVRTSNRITVGETEYVYLSPPDIKLSARIDTGANTSSLNAINLVEFERDGKPYARFFITNPANGKNIEIERRIVKRIRIKEHEGESQRRPIVKMRVRLGSLDQHIEMSLINRSDFEHQVLIGRNFLRDFAIVDVSKKYISQPVIEKN